MSASYKALGTVESIIDNLRQSDFVTLYGEKCLDGLNDWKNDIAKSIDKGMREETQTLSDLPESAPRFPGDTKAHMEEPEIGI